MGGFGFVRKDIVSCLDCLSDCVLEFLQSASGVFVVVRVDVASWLDRRSDDIEINVALKCFPKFWCSTCCH